MLKRASEVLFVLFVSILLSLSAGGCKDECEELGGTWEPWMTPESRQLHVKTDRASCCQVSRSGGRWNETWIGITQCNGSFQCSSSSWSLLSVETDRQGTASQLTCKEPDLWDRVEKLCGWDIDTLQDCWLPSGVYPPSYYGSP